MADRLEITLIKSGIGRPEKHKKILKGLGLTKLNRTVLRPDTTEIRGMINKVPHLVRVRELKD